jgi:hypothetical protein
MNEKTAMSKNYNPQGSDAAVNAARRLQEEGFGSAWEVIVSNDNTLQLDYDSDSLPENFASIMSILAQRFPREQITYAVFNSKSGKHLHTVIHLPAPMPQMERIAWQGAFGSDGKREALILLNIASDVANPVLLFMQKDRTEILTSVSTFTGVRGGIGDEDE